MIEVETAAEKRERLWKEANKRKPERVLTKEDQEQELAVLRLRAEDALKMPDHLHSVRRKAAKTAHRNWRRLLRRERDRQRLTMSLQDLLEEPGIASFEAAVITRELLDRMLAALPANQRDFLLENPTSRETKNLIRKVRRVASRKNSSD